MAGLIYAPTATGAGIPFGAEGFAAALLYTARTKLAFSLKKEVCHPESQAFCAWVESGGAA